MAPQAVFVMVSSQMNLLEWLQKLGEFCFRLASCFMYLARGDLSKWQPKFHRDRFYILLGLV
jgi:hypothetical protein